MVFTNVFHKLVGTLDVLADKVSVLADSAESTSDLKVAVSLYGHLCHAAERLAYIAEGDAVVSQQHFEQTEAPEAKLELKFEEDAVEVVDARVDNDIVTEEFEVVPVRATVADDEGAGELD